MSPDDAVGCFSAPILFAPAGSIPKRLADHKRGDCLWPLGPTRDEGDWRTLFCCAPVSGRGSYCARHGERAYLPSSEPEASPLVGGAR